MDSVMQRSHNLRNDPSKHYNCAQGVFIPFAEQKGFSSEEAAALTDNFGAGMRLGLTCGSITGGLMVLGLYGINEPKEAAAFIRRIAKKHEGRTQCRDLLRNEVHKAEEKKPHCDTMVYDAVEIIEDMLKDHHIAWE